MGQGHLFCHPELVSGSHRLVGLNQEMLKQVQHDK